MRSRAQIPNLLPQTNEVIFLSLLSLPAQRRERASQQQRDRACADAAENRNRRGSVDVIPLVCDCGARIYYLVRVCERRRVRRCPTTNHTPRRRPTKPRGRNARRRRKEQSNGCRRKNMIPTRRFEFRRLGFTRRVISYPSSAA